ncbi:hypothetical protein BZA05DRAFT_3132 [Tricharina praecox]|uniref:uncharacterized protein n=1 Tax=Tricharina praecox TaxID=43433 RepID=UPI00221F80AD|nr:uncharacterized protein BZA05DRAFT_3132 [Tricharina praecox]KAI5858434.1 hypothetical protein BZA05DRAFT_3132 [Tricharina praecox]
MLHKVEDGQDKSYRLRGTQRCRLLQYSHDSRNLFYTDSLHNSVQSYSLSDNRVADAARSHPSPITAFAVSCDSNLIISASSKPPTVQIHNQMMATTISLVPSASSAPVVTCAFHPSRKHIFLLAFGDGVLAAFDYTKLSPAKAGNKENAGLGVTRCHARGIHTFRHLHDPSIAGSAGITGAGFVPGQRSRAVTVGEDGRCFLVDFEKGDTLGSWHIGAPATGLTIREIDAAAKSRKEELGGYFIGVGTVHGRCLVYDGNGNKVAERVVDTEGESILDVEWVCGDVSAPEVDIAPTQPSPENAASREQPGKSDRTRKSTKALQSQKLNMSSSPVSPEEVDEDGNPLIKEVSARRRHRAFSPPVYDSLEDAADQGYMMLFSPVKRSRVSKSASLPGKKTEKIHRPSDPRARASTQSSDHRSAISAPQLWDDGVPDNGETKEEAEVEPEELDAFSAFQGDVQKDTTTTGEESGSNNVSIFGGLSSVRTDRIKVDEATDDGRILSEIRSIRALYSGKSKSVTEPENPPALPEPFVPPTKARSTPASRAGRESVDASSIKRSISAPEKKMHASELFVPDGEDGTHQSAFGATGAGPEKTSTQEEQVQPDQKEQVPEELATEEDEDIWAALAVGKRAGRLGRKRKKAPLEEESMIANTLPDTRADPSRSSTIRSAKSRKTVSWSDDPEPQADLFPTPMASSSVMGQYGGEGVSSSRSYLGSRPLSVLSEHHNDNSRIVTNSTATASKPIISDGGDIGGIVRAAVEQMQAAMSQQISALQAEMQRQFSAQHDELQGLRTEMARVREENQKLRGALFQSTGVRDSVGRAMGSGSG